MPQPNQTTDDILLVDPQNQHVENLVNETEEDEVSDEFGESDDDPNYEGSDVSENDTNNWHMCFMMSCLMFKDYTDNWKRFFSTWAIFTILFYTRILTRKYLCLYMSLIWFVVWFWNFLEISYNLI